MRRRLVQTFTLVTCLLAVTTMAAAETVIQLTSDPSDYIGQGQDYLYYSDTTTITATRNFDNGVTIRITGTEYWTVDLAAPHSVDLTVGTYENATRFPFQAPMAPGLSASGNGRGCNTLTGRFEVFEAVYDPATGNVLKFAADFEQHCEGFAPALFGKIRWNSAVPLNAPPDNCGGLPITLMGTEEDDVLTGTNAQDVIHGLGGNDTIQGLAGNDIICGGAGDDTIDGNDGHDSLFGESGNDTLDGGRQHDVLLGGHGADHLEGGNGQDTLQGEDGDDTLHGGNGHDVLLGGNGSDDLHGDSGNDMCDGSVDSVPDNAGSSCDVVTRIP